MPRPARPLDRADQGVQAELDRGRLLARRREPPDAHPHLRHRVLLQAASSRSTWSCSSRPARATIAASARSSGLFMLRRRGARDAVLAAAGHRPPAPDRARGPRPARAPRLRRRSRPRRSSTWSSGSAPATGTTTARTCSSPPSRTASSRCRPMNCPGACLVYASERRSYRDLPLRLAEFGLVSRNEREGVLHGLLRVRAFTQDDAHVYCTPEQVTDEVDSICQAIDELYARFGFDEVRVELSTRPDKHIGTDGAVGARRGCPARGARAPGPRVRGEPRRGHLLRAEDRLPRHRRPGPLVAVRHLPARLPDARALRAHLPGRRTTPSTGR